MGTQIKKHYWPNGALSHHFIIINNKITTAMRYNQAGQFLSNQPYLYSFKIQDQRYFFWNTADHKDTVEIIDDYE
jgi:hypothetical protein